jgi:Bacterial Ig-like domain (group 2)
MTININQMEKKIIMKRKELSLTAYYLTIGLIASLILFMVACSSTSSTTPTSPTSTTTKPTASISSIAVSPTSPPNLTKGSIFQFTATGTYSDNSTANISDKVKWTSSDQTIVTFVPSAAGSGFVDGMGVGTASITASLDGITSPPVNLTVVAPTTTATSP